MSQLDARTELKIPDIPGYVTLKCDFHIHTVFSDGSVWPDIRPYEVWHEGLDALSITDHIGPQPHDSDRPIGHNKPYELALSMAKSLNLILIRGAEISWDMPPGHLNALFLEDANPLDTAGHKDAIKAAVGQGAFVIWNHPGSVWYPEHEELYADGWMHGMEVVCNETYYPRAHEWCLEKNLTMIGATDVHDPTDLEYDFANGAHRPMTLVFTRDRTQEALKESLFARRTAVYWEDSIIGEEQYLRPLFDASIEVVTPPVRIGGKGRANIQIHNKSCIDLKLVSDGGVEEISTPRSITLYAGKTVLLGIQGKSKDLTGRQELSIPYRVENLLTAPEESLSVQLSIAVTFVPE